ncbi:MAG: DUF1064 domain-containing protein [Oscillospiraceae bacterium]|nr:DUF1064 domain-containing protein [Oscillospiraceae bacterium]
MNKLHAKKKICNQGHVHHSILEAKRCDELHLMQKQGMISNLEIQKKFVILEAQKYNGMPNERSIVYNADFVYTENGITVIEDTKGYKTKDYNIKRKFVKKLYCTDGKTVFREYIAKQKPKKEK